MAQNKQDGRYSCAFDIGGTFTDFVLLDRQSQKLHLHKTLTTPCDPAKGAIEGLEQLLDKAAIGFSDLSLAAHGTTLVTNLVIERRGARTALITTEGFRDIIEFGTEQRYDVHDIFLKFPDPIVPRSRRYEVTERMSHAGDVIQPVNLDQVASIMDAAVADGVAAVAVVLLHSYRNNAHERLIEQFVRQQYPQIRVSTSSDVCGEIREYERAITTVVNAYAQPKIEPYLDRLQSELTHRGFDGSLQLMQSSGDLASIDMMRRFPIRLLESGPAGGVLAASIFGKSIGEDNVIAFDMGGTTAKVCLIQNGRMDIAPMLEAAREHRFKRGSGLPIRTPVVDLIEIGAGGGSIARIDNIGLLKVGPESAGADPGPACYGNGGTQPTVTDANLILGYLSPDNFLGGRLKLDRSASECAFAALSKQFNGCIEDAAWGVYSVVCENMAVAARVHVVEKGRDPRNFAMIAFGGAGPAHAVRIAKSIGVSRVVVPPASGAASAFGFLNGAVAHEATRSAPGLLSELDWDEAISITHELEAEGRRLVRTSGLDNASVSTSSEVELRVSGQLHVLRIQVPSGTLSNKVVPELRKAFDGAYRDLYGGSPPDGELEVISWRVTCRGPAPRPAPTALVDSQATSRSVGERRAWFPETRGFASTKVYRRYDLKPGAKVEGPAIIEEDESTTVVPPGDSLEVDGQGNLIISISDTRASNIDVSTADAINADPAGLEIMWSRLVSISEECWHTVIRTAFSLIIGEAQDFACEILDANGKSLAHSPRAMPVFNISLMSGVRSLLKAYPAETLKPGDVLVTNDPWLCAGHLFDIALVTPVFHNNRVVAFIGSIGHVSDIGGTKDRASVREVFDEGLQIPPMKLYRQGQPNEDLFRILAENVRNPRQVLGDIQSLVAANQVGTERLQAFMHEYGFSDLEALSGVLQERAEKAIRAEISKVPDGVYRGATTFNGAGNPLVIPVKLTVKGDTIDVDYDGCPPQMPRGGINCTMTVTQAETLFALKCIFSPGIRATAGCYRPFTVSAPEGSLLNCQRPASVNLRRLTMWQFIGMIFRALSGALPKQVQAYTALPTLIDLYGLTSNGQVCTDHIFLGGGQGASHCQDGKSGLIWPTSAANTSIEMVESRLPVLVTEKSLIANSGGGGQFRGGLGQRLRLRPTRNSNHPLMVNVYPEGCGITTDGLHGGRQGGGTRAFLHSAKNSGFREIETPEMVELTSVDDIIEVHVGGGAGFGPASKREPALVRGDVVEGYVSETDSRPSDVQRMAEPECLLNS